MLNQETSAKKFPEKFNMIESKTLEASSDVSLKLSKFYSTEIGTNDQREKHVVDYRGITGILELFGINK